MAMIPFFRRSGSTPCTGTNEPPRNRRHLSGTETVVVIVVLVLAGALAYSGMPVFGIIDLLAGTAYVATKLVTSTRSGNGPVAQTVPTA
ncbi:hypothetical protein ACIA8O_37315 [Kitasatospora sp. NPDC051853]|uniref:hypothetical protein n=1 Tax=Kitasatospora sp. NPDC051853 TaxID=3364058 RepID=UPI0037A4B7BB